MHHSADADEQNMITCAPYVLAKQVLFYGI